MKIDRGVVGLLVFVVSLWVVALATYARQTGDRTQVKGLQSLQEASCSSSSSSSSGE